MLSFFGHSNYKPEADDESRLLTLLEDISKSEQIDFYLGGYWNFDI